MLLEVRTYSGVYSIIAVVDNDVSENYKSVAQTFTTPSVTGNSTLMNKMRKASCHALYKNNQQIGFVYTIRKADVSYVEMVAIHMVDKTDRVGAVILYDWVISRYRSIRVYPTTLMVQGLVNIATQESLRLWYQKACNYLAVRYSDDRHSKYSKIVTYFTVKE